MAIYQARARWSGNPGGDGFTVMNFDATVGASAVDTIVGEMAAFLAAFAPHMPTSISCQVEGEVKEIDEVTGNLIGYEQASSTPAPFSGSGTSSEHAAGVGLAITWRTNGVRNNRRITGKTYILPLRNEAFDSAGTILQAVRNDADNAILTFLTDVALSGAAFGVWSRPSANLPAGSYVDASGGTVKDQVAVLATRRF